MLKECIYLHNIWDSGRDTLKTTIALYDVIMGKGIPAIDEIITIITYVWEWMVLEAVLEIITYMYIMYKRSLLRQNKGNANLLQYAQYFRFELQMQINIYKYMCLGKNRKYLAEEIMKSLKM